MTKVLTRNRADDHTCHAKNCQTHVPPSMFMCAPHWRRVPRAMQRKLLDAYVPGQENRMDPSEEYLEVAQECIDIVWNKENK